MLASQGELALLSWQSPLHWWWKIINGLSRLMLSVSICWATKSCCQQLASITYDHTYITLSVKDWGTLAVVLDLTQTSPLSLLCTCCCNWNLNDLKIFIEPLLDFKHCVRCPAIAWNQINCLCSWRAHSLERNKQTIRHWRWEVGGVW